MPASNSVTPKATAAATNPASAAKGAPDSLVVGWRRASTSTATALQSAAPALALLVTSATFRREFREPGRSIRRTRRQFASRTEEPTMNRTTTRFGHTLVIGGSMAGLATARVLADHAYTVTVLDRDDLSTGRQPRRAVPQGQHAHALLAGGARTIEALFPGIMDEMVADGAAVLDFNDGAWHQGGYRARSLIERKVISASRPFLENHLRRRVAGLSNVEIRSGVSVEGLVADGGRVRGVKVANGDTYDVLAADFVVDCSGRPSQADRWLPEIGFAAPAVSEVRCDTRYSSMILQRSDGDIDGTFAVIIETPPQGKRAAFLLPIEDGRWMATIAASFGAVAPRDERSFRAIAASLPAPEMSRALAHAEPLTAVTTHRLPTSKRRHYEKQRRVPAGFAALGDSICSFNPKYGQGMSSAILQAVALGEAVADHANDDSLVRAFYQRAAKVLATPWQISVVADFAYPECKGPKPAGATLVNRYMARVLLAAEVSPEVNTAMILVQNLLKPPSLLMRPTMMLKVWRAAREAERRAAVDSSRPAPQARVARAA
jgi:2-polyprenyl-6-methoxyphenol hydroxylase-like FAD-dependent oxidoreductase